jgi:uncharacterized damage-inducible protein DinB
MTPAERELALNQLAESRERLLRTVHGLSETQLTYKPRPDRWSVADLIEHLAVVETRILGLIQQSLATAPDPSKRGAMTDEALVEDVACRVTRFQAPEFLAPTGRWTAEQRVPEFEAARKRTVEFVAGTNADLRRHFARHPVLGELDCYQWVLLLSAHCDRHRAQGEEVKADAGFPRAAAAG